MESQFKNKRVLITGAGKGIGRAMCIHLAKLKAQVIAISRTQSDLDSLKLENRSIEVHLADVNDYDAIEKLLNDIGPVDCLVNNAAVLIRKPVLEVTKDDLDNVTDINYKAAFHVLQVVAKQMIASNIQGTVVNLSSICGFSSVRGLSTYCGTKGALNMMTKCFALELAPYKIRVNSLNPTLISSGMVRAFPDKAEDAVKGIPLDRLVGDEDVVKSVMYLLSDISSMVTGVNLLIDGGHMLQLVAF